MPAASGHRRFTFDRWRPHWSKTLAALLFKRHHTQLNNMWWAHEGVRQKAFGLTTGLDASSPMAALFPIAGNEKRGTYALGKWAENYDSFDRWARLSMAMAIAGYLEVFLAQICGAALESCPAIIIGGTREIEGLTLLKTRKAYNFYENIEGIVKGDWNARASTYKELFGTEPFHAHIAELENLRKTRNDVGHAFGRKIISLQGLTVAMATRLPMLSETRLKNWLSLVDKVASVVERDLGERFVGSYEMLRLYHQWLPSAPTGESPSRMGQIFNEYAARVIGHPVGKAYLIPLVSYYSAH